MTTFATSTSRDAHTNKLQWRIRFVSLPHALLMHPTFSEISGGASKLLLALLSNYVGNNNGHLTATLSRMKAYGFHSKDSLSRGLRELIKFGYIVRTCSQHLRSPALYAVTWLPIDQPPVGRIYESGVTPCSEALDLWRQIDPYTIKAAA